MTSINSCNLSGVVTAVKSTKGAAYLTMTQTVGGKFETAYHVVVAPPLRDSVLVSEGDEILLLSALCYQINGEMRFRVSEENQLTFMRRNLNLGSIDAKDKFM